jgi:hypothetical protein
MSETVEQGARRRRGRSPSYPALDLEMAIQRAQSLYRREAQYPIPAEAVVRAWSYKSLNGPASSALAALKKFGLLEDEGSGDERRFRVTDLAVEILQNPDPEARLAAIQKAALQPPIHQELWEQYGNGKPLPSDETLTWNLTRQRGFTATGASEFIKEYKATISFAQLASGDKVEAQEPEPEEHKDDVPPQDQPAQPAQVTPPPPPPNIRRHVRQRAVSEGGTAYAVPVAAGSDVVIEGHFPLSEREWTQFISVLNAMKPGLVEEPDSEERPAAAGDDLADQ